MDRDRLFKELLTTFFAEFLDLFLPDLSAALDRSAVIVPMEPTSEAGRVSEAGGGAAGHQGGRVIPSVPPGSCKKAKHPHT
jgi:hypothetical protein